MNSISHVAIYTNNLERLSNFYQNYFFAIKDADYFNPKTGLKSVFLRLNGQTRLELMTIPGLVERPNDKTFTGLAHIAFSVGSEAEVDSHTAELVKGGYAIIKPPRVTGDGYYESCIADPDGNLIEITK